jgi:hypothetical protein
VAEQKTIVSEGRTPALQGLNREPRFRRIPGLLRQTFRPGVRPELSGVRFSWMTRIEPRGHVPMQERGRAVT